jgi:hypothetical protein
MRFVRLPSVAVGTIAGVEISFMALTVVGEMKKMEEFFL